jgi:hypothetical protein
MNDRDAVIRGLIARQPAGPAGAAGLLQRVCTAATQALSASGAGISVMTEGGLRGVSAASDPHSARIEELQFVLGEGPCMDAFATRRPVLVPDLADGAGRRWPMYTPAAQEGGIRAVFAFPLQIGAMRLGVLDVLREDTGPLTGDQLPLALTFADVTVAALLDQQEVAGAEESGADLAAAVENSAELFQAQGMVMVQLGISINEAMVRMRAYAFAEGRSLGEIAHDVVTRRLRFDQDQP